MSALLFMGCLLVAFCIHKMEKVCKVSFKVFKLWDFQIDGECGCSKRLPRVRKK